MLTVFEGSEKKCEVIMGDDALNLRSLERDFWVGMVDACAATILSSSHNDTCMSDTILDVATSAPTRPAYVAMLSWHYIISDYLDQRISGHVLPKLDWYLTDRVACRPPMFICELTHVTRQPCGFACMPDVSRHGTHIEHEVSV